jgi:hypothetical protein
MDIRKIILSFHLYQFDKKLHVKRFINDVATCSNREDFIALLNKWNHHEPEKVVDYILNEYKDYTEEYVDRRIAWSLRKVKETTGVEFTIDYIDTYQYTDMELNELEYQLFSWAE